MMVMMMMKLLVLSYWDLYIEMIYGSWVSVIYEEQL